MSSVSYTLGANLENLMLTGTGAINGTGNDLDNQITGNATNNFINVCGFEIGISLTLNMPPPTSSTDTSNVPPPKSNTRMVWRDCLSNPQAKDAAVGAFTIPITSSPQTLALRLRNFDFWKRECIKVLAIAWRFAKREATFKEPSMDGSHIHRLIESVHQELLPRLRIESVDPHNPVEVRHVPKPWLLLGAGNYAAVVYHPNYPDQVVKIYAPGRPGFFEEVEVYRRLGSHPAFSKCLYAGDGFLVLKRLYGVTLYDCMHQGLRIPKQVIRDIDQALDYARGRGLHPHDVHGRNVMMQEGRGLVVDVSDFLQEETCSKWNDLKKAYYWLYRPLLSPLRLRVPYFVLDVVRRSYRLFIKLPSRLRQLFRLCKTFGQSPRNRNN